MMKNDVKNYDHASDLIEEDPFNNGNQAEIYLSLDWDNESVYADTYYRDGSTPGDVWVGKRYMLRLPANVDASALRDDVEALMPRIQEIANGWELVYDGNNYRGKLTDVATEALESLRYEVSENPGRLLTLSDMGGIWDAEEWFVDCHREITAETSDDDIADLAETEEYDARVAEGVIIRGGVDRVKTLFMEYRDQKREAKEASSHEFAVSGKEAREFVVRSGGSSARINVPLSWQGCRVLCVRLD